MNVRCPSCDTLFRVDPAKVPDQGVRVRCAECPAVISVIHLPGDVSAVSALKSAATIPTPAISEPQAVNVVEQATPVVDRPSSHSATVPAVPAPEIAELPTTSAKAEPAAVRQQPIPEAPIATPDVVGFDILPPTESLETAPVPEPYVPPETEVEGIPPFSDAGIVSYSEPVLDVPPQAETAEALPAAEPQMPAASELPVAETEPEARPPLEVLPNDVGPSAAEPRRYTRPFIKSPEEAEISPSPDPSEPLRPTAPVFRPTPGMPIQTAPPSEQRPRAEAPAAQSVPPASATPPAGVPTQTPPPDPVAAPEPAPKRPVNPFLSKDPKQKARRLARALVSDMIVYQPQKRQEALAAGTLKESFNEEIKKSWQEYVEQVGEDLANSTEFFKQALNEILAGGNEMF